MRFVPPSWMRAVAVATLLSNAAFLLAARPAHATAPAGAGVQATGETPSQTERAADLYDQAKNSYDRAEYSQAAQLFLDADALVPSSEALSSAIAAARRAADHLLIARGALRAIHREHLDAPLAASAKAALAEAEPHLVRLSAHCTPEPCSLFLDGQALLDSTSYVAPGKHQLLAQSSEDGRPPRSVVKPFSAAAGQQLTQLLEVPAPPNDVPAVAAQPPRPPLQVSTTTRDTSHSVARPLPPWAFWLGVGATAVLTGVTTWSGVDALNEKAGLPDQGASDYAAVKAQVESSAQRTDWLLGATLLTAAATGVAGIWFVEWHESGTKAGAVPLHGGAALQLRGSFQ